MPYLVESVIAAGTWGSAPQPVIPAGCLRLRPWVPTDADVLVEAYADPAIQQWHARSMTVPEAQEWIERKTRTWADETAADWALEAGDRVVGRVGFRWLALGDGCAEIAYWTHPRARGEGHARGAVRALTQWAVGVGLHRIELRHAVANTASCRVAEACGYRHEGTAISAMLHGDGWHDMHVHGFVAPPATGEGGRSPLRPAPVRR